MKNLKYLMLLVAMFAVLTAQAKIRFGVKGGVNIANVKFDKEVFESDNITGFHIGPTIEAMFFKNAGLGFDASILYSQKGFSVEDETFRNSYLEIPVNLKFKLGIPIVNPYVSMGPYVDFRIAGDDKWDIKQDLKDVNDQIEAKSFGAGLNFAAGVELFSQLQLGVNYCWGLTDNYESFDSSNIDSYTGKSHTWCISATVFF